MIRDLIMRLKGFKKFNMSEGACWVRGDSAPLWFTDEYIKSLSILRLLEITR